ncbi:GGDEF domain-containing protein [Alginatibacterium sediminis]|nr:GGDEF domain-containing protein [Alginatibacterium sediminis]
MLQYLKAVGNTDYGVRETRLLGLCLLIATLSFGFIFYQLGFTAIVQMDCVYFLLYMGLLYGSLKSDSRIINELMLLSSLSQVLIITIFFIGTGPGLHLYSIGMIPTAYVVIDPHYTKQRMRVISCCIIGLVFAETQTFFSPIYTIAENIQYILKASVTFSVSFMVFGFYYLFFNDIERQSNMLKHLSEIDELTQLANRRHFMNVLDNVSCSSKQHSLLFIDLDHFKLINDNYGHIVGDDVLIDASRVLRDFCSDGEIVARLGGEEFAILLINNPRQSAIARATSLCKSIETRQVPIKGKSEVLVSYTASIGVSNLTNDINHSLSLADDAMYLAKQQGRNQAIFL